MGDCVEVRVCNPGQGFPAQKRDELFAMFVRGQTESTTPGTGLGLAICRAIIKAHDGVIGAEDRRKVVLVSALPFRRVFRRYWRKRPYEHPFPQGAAD